MRRTAFLLALLIGISSVLSPAWAGVAPAAAFTEGDHRRWAEYPAQFKVFTAQDDTCALSIHASLYSKEAGAALWAQVQEDVARIVALKSAKTRAPDVYIVPGTLSGGVEIRGSRLYCSLEDVGSGAYRPALTSATLDISEPWLMVGLSACAFGGTWDDAALKQHYEAAENLDMLSLFAAYFYEAFVGKEQVVLARDTAASLCSFALGKDGVDALLAKGPGYVQPWLAALGVAQSYENPYAGLFDGFRYAADRQYPFIVTTPRRDVYYVMPGEARADTPAQVQEALAESVRGIPAILAYVKEHAPDAYPAVAANYAEPIYFYFGGPYRPFDGPSTATSDRRVPLTDSDHLLHETVHLLTQPVFKVGNPVRWPEEAVAMYLTDVTHPTQQTRLRYYRLLTEQVPGDSTDAQFMRLMQQLYAQALDGKMPERPEDVDILALLKAGAKARFLKPDLPVVDLYFMMRPLYERRRNRPAQPAEGDELAPAQILAFGEYLISKHGLTPLLTLCLDKSRNFRDVFGMEYSEAKAEFVDVIIKSQED